MADIEILDREILPCGCLTGCVLINSEKVFVIQPCSLRCENYLFAVAESKRQGKPVEKRSHL